MPASVTDGARVIAIIAAMPEELAPLRSRLVGARRIGAAGAGEIVSGRLGGLPVALAVTGDGQRNARQGVEALLAAVSVERLVAIGVAGALSPELGRCALVVAERVLDEAGGSANADGALVAAAAQGSGARRGLVVSAERIADTAAEKRRLLAVARAGGDARGQSLPAVVDLESASYAAAAARAEIPWLVLRAVSDTADEPLPALLNRCRDEGGAVRRGGVARELLREPGALPILLLLRRRVQKCADVLARATEGLLLTSASSLLPDPHPIANRAQGDI